jgi:uncharacterized protein (DUF1499 family)
MQPLKVKYLKIRLLNIKQLGAISIALLLSACAGSPPADLGMVEGSELRPCPSTPNCLQTYDPLDSDHFVSPLSVKTNALDTKQTMTAAITETGGRIISEQTLDSEGYYLHAEYESDWLKFVDDVEVIIQDNSIQFRSASRIGRSDFGVNNKRFEKIKAFYQGFSTPND